MSGYVRGYPQPRRTVWYSRDGGPWHQIDINARSLVSRQISLMKPGRIYDDGYGNRYATENPEGEPRER